jgi:hypothetical protein
MARPKRIHGLPPIERYEITASNAGSQRNKTSTPWALAMLEKEKTPFGT